jgi:hypothetical protein
MASAQDWSAGVIPGTTSQADPWAPGVAGSAGVALGTGTGQHGNVPLQDVMGSGINAVMDWLNKPFTTPMSSIDVFLLVGTVLTAIIIWNFLMYHIRIAAETVV